MRIEETVLYDEFIRARQQAIALTDEYREAKHADAPERDQLWARVVRQTETARILLESWLEYGEPAPEVPYRELVAHF